MPVAFSTPNLVALPITSQESSWGGGLFCPPTKIGLSNSPTTIRLKTSFAYTMQGFGVGAGFGANFAAVLVLRISFVCSRQSLWIKVSIEETVANVP